MSKLDELIQQLCPDGVEWKTLNDIGEFFGGLTGKSKNDFIDGNAAFITYSNIYSNPSLNLNIDEKVRIDDGEKQNVIQYGDILFTGSSETPEECGMSSVVTKEPTEKMYLNSFCFGLRLFELDKFNFDYLKHLFRSAEIRKEICKTANGVTRFNVSKKKMGEIAIPLPPLLVQEEIVRLLDQLTETTEKYQAELEAELDVRKKQYEEYRNQLLTFDATRTDVEWKSISDIGLLVRGNGLQKKDFTESGCGCIHYGQIYTYYGTYTDYTKSFVSTELAVTLTKVDKGNLVIACTSENIEDVCKSVAWLGSDQIVTGGHACVFKHNENPKYISYCFQTEWFFTQKRKYARGAKVIDIKTDDLGKIILPIPPLTEQERIVNILDRMDKTHKELCQSIETEIKMRKQQYEYYRDKLLTFKKKEE